MVGDDERNWKTDIETREVEDFRRLWSQCAAAGCTAIFIAPLALMTLSYLGAGLEAGRWSTRLAYGEFIARCLWFYGLSLLVSLPVSIPCAIVFAVASYRLHRAGRLNWLTSAITGALIGIATAMLWVLALSDGKAQYGVLLAIAAFMALVAASTTLAAYVLCLRRL